MRITINGNNYNKKTIAKYLYYIYDLARSHNLNNLDTYNLNLRDYELLKIYNISPDNAYSRMIKCLSELSIIKCTSHDYGQKSCRQYNINLDFYFKYLKICLDELKDFLKEKDNKAHKTVYRKIHSFFYYTDSIVKDNEKAKLIDGKDLFVLNKRQTYTVAGELANVHSESDGKCLTISGKNTATQMAAVVKFMKYHKSGKLDKQKDFYFMEKDGFSKEQMNYLISEFRISLANTKLNQLIIKEINGYNLIEWCNLSRE